MGNGKFAWYRAPSCRSSRRLLIYLPAALTSPEIEVPEGHYAEDNMKATVVPNRNMILLAVATGCSVVSQKFDQVAYAAHSGDHAIYPTVERSLPKLWKKQLN